MAAIAALGLLAACGRQEGRGGLTADEERQLDNAAEMLDQNTIASPDSLTMNEQQLDALGEETIVEDNGSNVAD
jgi:hypothetical protein